MKRKIPAFTLSGGLLSDFGGHKAVKEYRVWYHPDTGEDAYKKSRTFKGVLNVWRKLKDEEPYVEPPLAVVWDDKYKDYREVVIDELKPIEETWHSKYKEGMEKGLGAHASVGYASSRPTEQFIERLRLK